MSRGPLRRAARTIGALLPLLYPASEADWSRAMRFEIEQVEGDAAALAFALGCLWGGCLEAARFAFSSATEGMKGMQRLDLGRLREPRNAALACAFAATMLGILYLVAAGAPPRYPIVNAAAFLLGVVALLGFDKAALHAEGRGDWLLLPLAASLIATALFGADADGAARWIRLGPLSLQVSMIVLPSMILLFARRPTFAGSAAIAAAALALALQPDRAMAGVLALAMATLAIARPSRASLAAVAASAAAFAATLALPDAAPAVPFVDGILYNAFDIHPLAGAAVLLGSLLLLVPASAGSRPEGAFLHLVFGSVWLGCIAAAALGNYPTPVVGYGGSAILGYLLSLSCLPWAAASAETRTGSPERDSAERGGLRRAAAAA